MCEMLPDIVSSEIDLIIKEDLKLIATEQIEIARQYFNPRSVAESALCTCATKIEALQRQLTLVESKNNRALAEKLEKQPPAPFCEQSLVNDEMVKFYTGLPNKRVLKAVFDHVFRTSPPDGITKLSPFQEFMCTLLKLRLNSHIEDLAYQFSISPSTISKIFSKWLK